MYPNLTPVERESELTREYRAVFVSGIGADLSDGKEHDGRAPDYDDWSSVNDDGFQGLNGDILLWNPVLERTFEISSMGVRVNKEAMLRQLTIRDMQERQNLVYHQRLLTGDFPESIGGGIGQSRLCMFLLRKANAGEVQASLWPDDMRKDCEANGIFLM